MKRFVVALLILTQSTIQAINLKGRTITETDSNEDAEEKSPYMQSLSQLGIKEYLTK